VPSSASERYPEQADRPALRVLSGALLPVCLLLGSESTLVAAELSPGVGVDERRPAALALADCDPMTSGEIEHDHGGVGGQQGRRVEARGVPELLIKQVLGDAMNRAAANQTSAAARRRSRRPAPEG